MRRDPRRKISDGGDKKTFSFCDFHIDCSHGIRVLHASQGGQAAAHLTFKALRLRVEILRFPQLYAVGESKEEACDDTVFVGRHLVVE